MRTSLLCLAVVISAVFSSGSAVSGFQGPTDAESYVSLSIASHCFVCFGAAGFLVFASFCCAFAIEK
jgi:hypothetical protein